MKTFQQLSGIAKLAALHSRFVRPAWNRLFPGICVLCQLPGVAGRNLCAHCHEALPWNLAACARCAEPMARGISECRHCDHHWPITQTVAPMLYSGYPQRWIGALKFHQHLVSGRLLADLLGDAVVEKYPTTSQTALPDRVVPLPLHWRRLMSRGLNQAQVLAQPISARLGVPLNYTQLQRQAAPLPQHTLSRDARLQNLTNAFSSKPWANQHIALVDDVITTGATAAAAARVCLAAGARRVDLWCATRTPSPLYSGGDQ